MKKLLSVILCLSMLMAVMVPATLTGYAADEGNDETTDVAISEENFPDENFRNYISEYFDKDKDGTLSAAEIEAVVYIDTYDIAPEGAYEDKIIDIKTFEGIVYFKNLKKLNCGGPSLTSLDVSKNTALEELSVENAPITELDVSNCKNLERLFCINTGVSSLDVSKCTKLEWLNCNNSSVSSIDVSGCTKLKTLICENTKLTSLDVSNNKSLEALSCSGSNIEKINLKSNHKIKYLYADKSTVILSAETFLRCKFEQNTPEKLINYIHFDVKEAEFSENKSIDKFCHFAADVLIKVTCTPGFWFFLIHDGNNG